MSPKLPLFALPLSLVAVLHCIPAIAQISPANDGTGTRVNRNGNEFRIDGGTLSGDGQSLFQSFEEFGLSANEIATFLSNPDIENVLGRVVGGNASVIDGLIRLSGGDSNLYLMNPAGVIFGSNAQLDVPGSFTATTANGIGFDNTWFHAIGENDYAALVGNPSAFAFSMSNPGSIFNSGELAVNAGQSLTLLGGTVINTGTLTAPGGTITVAAVPGENVVRISQDDALLSLELETLEGAEAIRATPRQTNAPNTLPFTPLDLPTLLSGSGLNHASEITVAADGTVRLTGSETVIPTGSGVAIASGTLDASSSNPAMDSPEINVLGDRVGILNATLDASTPSAGGTIRIGGDYQGQGTVFNASRTFVDANSAIAADALESGNGGRVIIWADETTGFYGSISAHGGGLAGDGGLVEVSGLEFLDFQGLVDTSAPNGNIGTLLLDPTNIEVVEAGGTAPSLADVDTFLDGDLGPGATTTIDAGLIDSALADVILQATNDITFNADINIVQPQASLTAEAGNSIVVNSNIATNGGDITLTANADDIGAGAVSIIGSTIATQGGNFTVSGVGTPALPNGILINNSNIDVSNGNIDFTGSGQVGQNLVDQAGGINGVVINGSTLETTSNGTISVQGFGGNEQNPAAARGNLNSGIVIFNSVLRTQNGFLKLEGRGGNGGEGNAGVRISNNSRIQTLTGDIDIDGTGGNGTGVSNYGVFIFNNAAILSGGAEIDDVNTNSATESGNIRIDGFGGSGLNNQRGISIGIGDVANPNRTTIATTGEGAIILDGTGGTGTFNNPGVTVGTASDIRTVGGELRIVGNGGRPDGVNGAPRGINRGIVLFSQFGSNISSINGDITLEGIGNGSDGGNRGIYFFVRDSDVDPSESITIRSTNGDINLIGTGSDSGTTTENDGIAITDNVLIETTGSGIVSLSGFSGDGTDDNRGIYLTNDAQISSHTSVLLTGISNGSGSSNHGVYLQNGDLITISDNGTIILNGTGSNGEGNSNKGIWINQASLISSINGDINLIGRGGDGDGNNSEGISLYNRSTISSIDGDINIVGVGGTGSGDFTQGIEVNRGATVETTGDGNITLQGDVSGNGNYNLGIFIGSDSPDFISRILTVDGKIRLVGNSNGVQDTEYGILIGSIFNLNNIDGIIESTGVGGIELEGSSTSAAGISLEQSLIRALGSGDISLTATDVEVNSIIEANSGDIIIRPFDRDSTIGIGDGTIGNFNLRTIELTNLSTSGEVIIGSPGLTGTGTISIGEIDLSRETYNLTIRGGDILFVDTTNNIQALRFPSNRTTQIISTGNIFEGERQEIAIDGSEGALLLDAEGTIGAFNNPGSPQLDINVSNFAARSRGNGDIRVGLGTFVVFPNQIMTRITTVGAISGVTTGGDGDIQLVTNGLPILIDQPITTNGEGDITIRATGGIELNSFISTNDGSILFRDDVELGLEGASITANGGDLTFQGRLNGFQDLSLRVGETVIFEEAVGDVNPLRRLAINAGNVETYDSVITSGAIAISNADTITLRGDVTTNGGSFRVLESDRLTLDNSSISTSGGNFLYRNSDALQIEGTGQLITAGGNIRLRGSEVSVDGAIALDSSADQQNGGNVIVRADSGSVRIGDVDSSGRQGGLVRLTSDTGRVIAGDITTTGAIAGGDVEVNAEIAIRTGDIRSRGLVEDGGDVFLDPRLDIEVGFIDARGGAEGIGGEVFAFTERFFRATNIFGNNISISTRGGQGSGSITINHDGGSRDTPFVIGESTINGTRGTITSSQSNTITSGSFPGRYTLGNIDLITTDFPPLPVVSTPSPDEAPNDFETTDPMDEADPASEFDTPTGENETISSPSVVDPGVADIDDGLTDEYIAYDPQIMPPGQTPSSPGSNTVSPGNNSSGENTGISQTPSSAGESNSEVDSSGGVIPDRNRPLAEDSDGLADDANPEDLAPADESPGLVPPDGGLEATPGSQPGSDSGFANSASSEDRELSLSEAQAHLSRLEQQTGIKPALIYAIFTPNPTAATSDEDASQESIDLNESSQDDSDQLELLLVTSSDSVIRIPVVGTQRADVLRSVRRFRNTLFTENTNAFSPDMQADHHEWAEQFYQWLIEPLEQELEEREIDTIAFLLDEGLRSLPLAALYDGDRYLVERFSIGLMPSLTLTSMEYVNINNANVLAMGASTFTQSDQDPLPATEVETAIITDTLWDGEAFMNEAFSRFNLQQQRQETPFGIVHLATHASFQRSQSEEAYIQLWGEERLRLSEIRQLDWHDPTVELVVLSACETAVGDANTELGFAGFSALAGVKSTLASLWTVDDAGTLGLMAEFYQQLSTAPIKADALRQAQLAMLNGEVSIHNGNLVWSEGNRSLPLEQNFPDEMQLTHPSFWAGFTMIGSPW